MVSNYFGGRGWDPQELDHHPLFDLLWSVLKLSWHLWEYHLAAIVFQWMYFYLPLQLWRELYSLGLSLLACGNTPEITVALTQQNFSLVSVDSQGLVWRQLQSPLGFKFLWSWCFTILITELPLHGLKWLLKLHHHICIPARRKEIAGPPPFRNIFWSYPHYPHYVSLVRTYPCTWPYPAVKKTVLGSMYLAKTQGVIVERKGR